MLWEVHFESHMILGGGTIDIFSVVAAIVVVLLKVLGDRGMYVAGFSGPETSLGAWASGRMMI